MSKLSRRALARYGAKQLLLGKTPTSQISKLLVAELIESKRTNEVDFLLSDIAWELEQRNELSTGRVTSAFKLTNEVKAELKFQLKKATKAGAVLLEEHIDKSVIGGIKVETSARVWDFTVTKKLDDLKGEF